jgi:hypothetical protein
MCAVVDELGEGGDLKAATDKRPLTALRQGGSVFGPRDVRMLRRGASCSAISLSLGLRLRPGSNVIDVYVGSLRRAAATADEGLEPLAPLVRVGLKSGPSVGRSSMRRRGTPPSSGDPLPEIGGRDDSQAAMFEGIVIELPPTAVYVVVGFWMFRSLPHVACNWLTFLERLRNFRQS